MTFLASILAAGQDTGQLGLDVYTDHVQLVERIPATGDQGPTLRDFMTRIRYIHSGSVYHPMAGLIDLLETYGIQMGISISQLKLPSNEVLDAHRGSVGATSLSRRMISQVTFSSGPIPEHGLSPWLDDRDTEIGVATDKMSNSSEGIGMSEAFTPDQSRGRISSSERWTAQDVELSSDVAKMFGFSEQGAAYARATFGNRACPGEPQGGINSCINGINRYIGNLIAQREPGLVSRIGSPESILQLQVDEARRVVTLASALDDNPHYRDMFSQVRTFFHQLKERNTHSNSAAEAFLQLLNGVHEPDNIGAFCHLETIAFGIVRMSSEFCTMLKDQIIRGPIRIVEVAQTNFDSNSTRPRENLSQSTRDDRGGSLAPSGSRDQVLEISRPLFMATLSQAYLPTYNFRPQFFQSYSSEWDRILSTYLSSGSEFDQNNMRSVFIRFNITSMCELYPDTCLRHLQDSHLQVHQFLNLSSFDTSEDCMRLQRSRPVNDRISNDACLIRSRIRDAIVNRQRNDVRAQAVSG